MTLKKRLAAEYREAQSRPEEGNGREVLAPIPKMLKVTQMSDVEPQEVDWAWENWIALGKCHLWVGMPGVGKSFTSAAIGATFTVGGMWPDRSGNAPIGEVVYLAGEDGLADTLRPRLDAQGADPEKAFVIESRLLIPEEGGEETEEQVRLDRDIGAIDDLLTEKPDVRVLFIDPVSQFLGKTDSHKDADVRGILGPLSRLAEKHHVAVINITHFNKMQQGPALYRAMGSLAFSAQARIAWGFLADPDDERRVLVLPLKSNIGIKPRGRAYWIIDGQLQWDAKEVDMTIEEAMQQPRREHVSTKLDEACEWLQGHLADGPVESKQLAGEAKAAGIAFSTFRRAKDTIKAVSVKGTYASSKGKWFISLPNQDAQGVPQYKYDEHLEHVEHLGDQDVQGVQDAHLNLVGDNDEHLGSDDSFDGGNDGDQDGF